MISYSSSPVNRKSYSVLRGGMRVALYDLKLGLYQRDFRFVMLKPGNSVWQIHWISFRTFWIVLLGYAGRWCHCEQRHPASVRWRKMQRNPTTPLHWRSDMRKALSSSRIATSSQWRASGMVAPVCAFCVAMSASNLSRCNLFKRSLQCSGVHIISGVCQSEINQGDTGSWYWPELFSEILSHLRNKLRDKMTIY